MPTTRARARRGPEVKDVIHSLIQHSAQNAKLEDSIDVVRFDATLSQIAGVNDPRATVDAPECGGG